MPKWPTWSLSVVALEVPGAEEGVGLLHEPAQRLGQLRRDGEGGGAVGRHVQLDVPPERHDAEVFAGQHRRVHEFGQRDRRELDPPGRFAGGDQGGAVLPPRGQPQAGLERHVVGPGAPRIEEELAPTRASLHQRYNPEPMDRSWKDLLWPQLGAAIDMLENAVLACPDELWSDRSQQPEFWYPVYHTLFFLDLFLSGTLEGFAPPAPFNLDELDPAGILPERPYTKDEMLAYLDHDRRKAQATLGALTDEKASRHFDFGWVAADFADLILYNLRHVQHHAAQLNLILRQKTDSAPRWVARAKGS